MRSDFRIMGVLNVTPDSFSDGGAYRTASAAIDAALRMVDDGASIIDVGGESTRPGSTLVHVDEELRRVMEVIPKLCGFGVTVSVDTRKAVVAREALSAGAAMVNDVSALADPEMADVCAAANCQVCLMHMQGEPATMQIAPSYANVVEEVISHLVLRANYAQRSGIEGSNIWLDPGVGFGKTDAHNWALIKHIDLLVKRGYPVLLGVSRKGFLGRALAHNGQAASLDERLTGGLAIQTYAQARGIAAIRTHDVRAAAEVSKILQLIGSSESLLLN